MTKTAVLGELTFSAVSASKIDAVQEKDLKRKPGLAGFALPTDTNGLGYRVYRMEMELLYGR